MTRALVGGENLHGVDTLLGQLRKIAGSTVLRHSTGPPAKNARTRDAAAANTGLAAPLAGRNGNDFAVSDGRVRCHYSKETTRETGTTQVNKSTAQTVCGGQKSRS